ncbi:multi-copper polyphenol oxidoreductase laccase [Campylobacter iguaniorum]|uniref:Purine nucleoside phosphorylase n=1 Tax=Campylobacter iguaniorum TaxID=1244531 RepID=A0A076FD00_9BACT|nr:peptidoglycan editing factor PgeF [Campylobacter iguaniorum]AII15267.1 multi-copper polyphenol oxidoreductase laccase [Campylobacter iguaniorum]ALV25193.1 multi-copper polyphenol oxidoreductase laccase [Campylobacter iguaniorum]
MLVCTDDDFAFAGFSSKFGGVSKGKFAGLNLATHVGDELGNVEQNREILRQKIGAKKLIFMEQIHSDVVSEISNLDAKIPPCDALITGLKGVAICVMVADCSPILVLDRASPKVAVIHAGRAGVISKILSKTIRKMGSNPANLEVIIGPNIKGNCYEIGDLDLGAFNAFKNGAKFDMDAALKNELESLGVASYKFSQICTHCDERFYSYRRDAITGRFCGFAYLRD